MYQPSKETTIKALWREWRVGVFGLGTIERFIAWIKTQVADPFAGLTPEMMAAMPPALAEKKYDEACAKRDALEALDYDDPLIRRFIGNPVMNEDGTVNVEASAKSMHKRGHFHLFHCLLQRHHPSLDYDTACDIITEIGHEEMVKAINNSQGRMEKNADGLAPSVK